MERFLQKLSNIKELFGMGQELSYYTEFPLKYKKEYDH